MAFLTLILNLLPAVTQRNLVCPEGPKRISQGFWGFCPFEHKWKNERNKRVRTLFSSFFYNCSQRLLFSSQWDSAVPCPENSTTVISHSSLEFFRIALEFCSCCYNFIFISTCRQILIATNLIVYFWSRTSIVVGEDANNFLSKISILKSF